MEYTRLVQAEVDTSKLDGRRSLESAASFQHFIDIRAAKESHKNTFELTLLSNINTVTLLG